MHCHVVSYSEGGIKMRNSYAKILIAVIIVLFCAQTSYGDTAFAQNAYLEEEGNDLQPGHSQDTKGILRDSIIRKLNLTDAQKEQLREKREEHKGQTQQMLEYLKAHRQSLKEELEKSDADKNRINNIIMEMKETEGRLLYLRTVGILETKEILTPEQFEKLQSFHQKSGQRRKGMRMNFRQQQTPPDEY